MVRLPSLVHQHAAKALDTLREALLGGGKAPPHIALALGSEGGARRQTQPRVADQPLAEFEAVGDALDAEPLAEVISTGALYYYDGEPAFTAVRTTPLERLWAIISPISTAYAHPGHYVSGNAMGQVLEPFSVDLLGDVATLPAGAGRVPPGRGRPRVAEAAGSACVRLYRTRTSDLCRRADGWGRIGGGRGSARPRCGVLLTDPHGSCAQGGRT